MTTGMCAEARALRKLTNRGSTFGCDSNGAERLACAGPVTMNIETRARDIRATSTLFIVDLLLESKLYRLMPLASESSPQRDETLSEVGARGSPAASCPRRSAAGNDPGRTPGQHG